jgi:hypothetical protein
MGRQFVVAGFMELKEILLRFHNSVIDVNDVLIGIVESQYFGDGRLQLTSRVGSFVSKIGDDTARIEGAGRRNLNRGC